MQCKMPITGNTVLTPSPFSKYTTSSVETLPLAPGAYGQPPSPATLLSTTLTPTCHKLPNSLPRIQMASSCYRYNHHRFNGRFAGEPGSASCPLFQDRTLQDWL